MLVKLRLANFKPFRLFSIDFTDLNVLVGKNNMGKSTLVDALRLISLEANYRLRRDLVRLPQDLFAEEVHGFMVEPERIPFPTANVHYEYESVTSRVTADFDNGVGIELVFTEPPETECYLAVRQDRMYLDSIEVIRRRLREISIAVLPPVAPFEEREEVLTQKYVQKWFGTHRSPRHFRNVWRWDPSGFDEFRQMLRDTWPGSDIGMPELNGDLRMYFTENRIAREIAWAGHGMQVWMQILTYLSKMSEFDTLVLDEPEIFLHSDVQRKLVGLLRQRASQTIVATHSVDIINEAPPSSLIEVDKRQKAANRLESAENIQRVIEGLGSVQNVQLLSLLRSRFALFVEGNDRRILRVLAEKLGHPGVFDGPFFSVVPLEGEGNWRRLKDLNWIWKNIVGEPIRSFVLLDRDYETDASIRMLTRTLRSSGVGVHVWLKKELENYLLIPRVIHSAITSGSRKRDRPQTEPTIADVEAKLAEVVGSHRDYVGGQLLGRLVAEKRAKKEDPSTTSTNFFREFARRWTALDYRVARAPGKEVLSELSRWAQSSFRVSLSADKLARHMRQEDIDLELSRTIRSIVERAQAG